MLVVGLAAPASRIGFVTWMGLARVSVVEQGPFVMHFSICVCFAAQSVTTQRASFDTGTDKLVQAFSAWLGMASYVSHPCVNRATWLVDHKARFHSDHRI